MKRGGEHVRQSVFANVLGLDVCRLRKLRSKEWVRRHDKAAERRHARGFREYIASAVL
jgi:hypothetical protein